MRETRTPVIGLALAVATTATWLALLPWRWKLAATDEPDTYTSAVPTWRFVVVAIVLVMLAVMSGSMGHPWLPVLTVAGPAFVLWCYQSATAETIGANLWVVGAIILAPVAFGGAALAGYLGSRFGSRARRTKLVRS